MDMEVNLPFPLSEGEEGGGFPSSTFPCCLLQETGQALATVREYS